MVDHESTLAVGQLLEVIDMTFLLSAIVQLIVLAAIVVGVGRLLRRGRGDRTGNGTASLRRFFTYGLLSGAVGIGAAGVWGLIVRALEPPLVADDGTTALARSLAFTLVGIPAAFGLFRATLARLAADPDEAASAAWRFYLSSVTALSLLAAMISGYIVVGSLFGTEDGSAAAIAWLVVSAAVWGIHWTAPVRTHHPPTGIHLLLGTVLGFGAVVGSAGVVVGRALEQVYTAWFANELAATDFGDVMLRATVGLFVGTLAWAWHWFRPARNEWSDMMWHGWVLIGGMLPGVLAILGAIGSLTLAALVWAVGDTGGEPAAAFFEFAPAAVTAALVGAFAATYHQRIHAAASPGRTEAGRAYDYLLTAVGLAAVLTGVSTLLVALFGVISGPVVAGEESSVNVLLAAVVAICIGGPLWARFWSRCERHAAARPEAELASPSRRSYVMAVLGVAGVVGLISGIIVLFVVLEDLLGGNAGTETIYDMRVALALVMTAGVAAVFHWNVFRRDQQQRPEAEIAATKHVIVLSSRPGLSEVIGGTRGFVVDHWQVVGRGTAAFDDPASVVAAIGDAAGDDVLVVEAADGTPLVLSFRTD